MKYLGYVLVVLIFLAPAVAILSQGRIAWGPRIAWALGTWVPCILAIAAAYTVAEFLFQGAGVILLALLCLFGGWIVYAFFAKWKRSSRPRLLP